MSKITTVVLADDDLDDVDIFKDLVATSNLNLKLEVVTNGMELMSLLDHILPDLVFLDLEMPYKNGLECLVEIRNTEALQNIPVVVFSATTRQSNIQTAYDMGGHLFLIKSPDYNEMKSSVKAILKLDWSNPMAIKEQYCVNNRYVPFM